MIEVDILMQSSREEAASGAGTVADREGTDSGEELAAGTRRRPGLGWRPAHRPCAATLSISGQ